MDRIYDDGCFLTYSFAHGVILIDLGDDMELTCHDGTVRDIIFMPDTAHKSSLLVSAGAGDCKICVTDCASGALLRAMPGHSGSLLHSCYQNTLFAIVCFCVLACHTHSIIRTV